MSLSTSAEDLETLEIQLLLEAVFRRYGFDFRDYAYSSIQRRIRQCVDEEKAHGITELQAKLLHDPAVMERFLLKITINVTSMFRDPDFYRAFRARVVPELRNQAFIRLWHVGCSTGEEVYSVAILLREEGLYSKCRIYATDMNEEVVFAQHNLVTDGSFNDFYVILCRNVMIYFNVVLPARLPGLLYEPLA